MMPTCSLLIQQTPRSRKTVSRSSFSTCTDAFVRYVAYCSRFALDGETTIPRTGPKPPQTSLAIRDCCVRNFCYGATSTPGVLVLVGGAAYVLGARRIDPGRSTEKKRRQE